MSSDDEFGPVELLLLKSLKHANKLTGLLSAFRPSATADVDRVTAALHSLRRVFIHYRDQNLLTPPPTKRDEDSKDDDDDDDKVTKAKAKAEDPQAVLRNWLRERYAVFQARLMAALHHDDATLRTVALRTAMALVDTPAAGSTSKTPPRRFAFEWFSRIMQHLVCDPSGNVDEDMFETLVTEFADEYDDVRYYLLKAVAAIAQRGLDGVELPADPSQRLPDGLALLRRTEPKTLSARLFQLLDLVSLPPNQEDMELQYLVKPAAKSRSGGKKAKVDAADGSGVSRLPKVSELHLQRRLFSEAWLTMLRLPLTPLMYRQVLMCLAEDVIPNMPNPLLLADFLTDSFGVGGVVSLLALDGLWILMQKHNLDYPQFYAKLYSLVTVETMHAKYRAKFLEMLDMFMRSGGLAAYIVAAFAKRIARVALTSPPSVAMFAIPFVYNLVQKHPSTARLVHRGGNLVARKPPAFRIRDVPFQTLDDVLGGDEDYVDDFASDVEEAEDPHDEDRETETKREKEVPKDTMPSRVVEPALPRQQPESESDEDADSGSDSDSDSSDDGGAGARARAGPKAGVGTAPVDVKSGSDVFDASTDDPSRCRALESSLWELTALQNHFHGPVSSLAKVFSSKWTKQRMEIKGFVQLTYDAMFNTEVQRRAGADVPIEFRRPSTFLTGSAQVIPEPEVHPGASSLPEAPAPIQSRGLFSLDNVTFVATPSTPSTAAAKSKADKKAKKTKTDKASKDTKKKKEKKEKKKEKKEKEAKTPVKGGKAGKANGEVATPATNGTKKTKKTSKKRSRS